MKKWRNKITGEISEFMVHKRIEDSEDGNPVYAPFDGHIDEWEDYEEPKEYWHIFGTNITKTQECLDELYDKRNKEIGNYFETKEEAEKAVEKLKAITRLKSCGFKFKGWRTADLGADKYYFVITAESDGAGKGDLDLLFGGEK